MFEKLGNAFSNIAKSLGEKELKEQDIDENLSQLEISLLESDVAIEVIDKIKLPVIPEKVLFGLIFVNLGPLNIFPKT